MPLRKPRDSEDARDRLEEALRILRAKGNAQKAAAEAKVSAERFRRFLRDEAIAARQARSWVISDQRPRNVQALTSNGVVQLEVRGFEAASLVYRHRQAVKQFLETNDASLLAPFAGASVGDVMGRTHLLETRPNALYRLAAMGGDGFEHVYRISHQT
ncbi:hypothetical protein [Phreatobacter sp.]|uniref:hypothetical protein n=1 Tax=Phreatobacter sp. TaxID=1966341 RepID=UPI003F72D799